MSAAKQDDTKKVTAIRLSEMKAQGEKISMLTSYDYTMASIVDGAGVDVILVGDSASNVMCGNQTTLPITIEEMIYHGKAVAKAAKRALVVIDMPFGYCVGNPLQSLESAVKIMKETGADAVKIEGGEELLPDIKKIIDAGIPVIGHLGLMPQSINKFGSYTVRAKENKEAEKLKRDALLLQEIGCSAIVLEKIPAVLATEVTKSLHIPTIGIGAGSGTDGQVLVVHDMLGMNQGFTPRFLRRYADLHTIMTDAVKQYVSDVKDVTFPNKEEEY